MKTIRRYRGGACGSKSSLTPAMFAWFSSRSDDQDKNARCLRLEAPPDLEPRLSLCASDSKLVRRARRVIRDANSIVLGCNAKRLLLGSVARAGEDVDVLTRNSDTDIR